MPDGKPAGVRCVQLTADNRCQIFGQPDRPEVCNRLRPNEEMCGQNAGEAFVYLIELERLTSPIAADFDAMRAQAKALLGEQSN